MPENAEARDKLAARLFNAYEQSQGRSPAFGLFVERERSAWQAVADEALRATAESLVPEPPFSEEHYRHHTPAGPNPSCLNCRWLNWSQPDE
jgi:hypothetical protein